MCMYVHSRYRYKYPLRAYVHVIGASIARVHFMYSLWGNVCARTLIHTLTHTHLHTSDVTEERVARTVRGLHSNANAFPSPPDVVQRRAM